MIKSGQLDNCSISDDLNCKMLLKYVLISQRGCSFSSNTNDMRSDSNDHEKTLLEKPSRKYVNTVLNKRVWCVQPLKYNAELSKPPTSHVTLIYTT